MKKIKNGLKGELKQKINVGEPTLKQLMSLENEMFLEDIKKEVEDFTNLYFLK